MSKTLRFLIPKNAYTKILGAIGIGGGSRGQLNGLMKQSQGEWAVALLEDTVGWSKTFENRRNEKCSRLLHVYG